MNDRETLKKLERKIEKLETRINDLEQRTNESRALQVASWTLVLLEIAVAVIAIVDSLVG